MVDLRLIVFVCPQHTTRLPVMSNTNEALTVRNGEIFHDMLARKELMGE
jgi:hypothetical protein